MGQFKELSVIARDLVFVGVVTLVGIFVPLWFVEPQNWHRFVGLFR